MSVGEINLQGVYNLAVMHIYILQKVKWYKNKKGNEITKYTLPQMVSDPLWLPRRSDDN